MRLADREGFLAEHIRGYLAVAARKDFVVGMQVWNFADFAAVQGINRVGGLNLKAIFTRTRQPTMAAQVLRQFWVKPLDRVAAIEQPEPAYAD